MKEKGVLCTLQGWVTETFPARKGLGKLNTGINPGKDWVGLTRRAGVRVAVEMENSKPDSDFDFVIYCM